MIRAALVVVAVVASAASVAAPPAPGPVDIVRGERQIQRRPIPTPEEGACLYRLRAAKETPAFVWAPDGWGLTCREDTSGQWGHAAWPTRVIVINASIPAVEQVAGYAHELGHAEMFEWPAWKRDALEQVTGRTLWDYWGPGGQLVWDRYVSDPGELWAQGRMFQATGLSLGGRPFYTAKTLGEWSSWQR